MGVMEILAFSIAAGAVSIALYSSDRVTKLENRIRELEDKLNRK
ncbi:hypothetical protein [Paucisalibacillus globulus]|nr:hypothetical protein [Paucisalibacillus globulus]